MGEDPCEVFDELPEIEIALSKELKMSLFHIPSYVTRKNDASSDASNDILLRNNI